MAGRASCNSGTKATGGGRFSPRRAKWRGCAGKRARALVINDRADFALLLDAGLHVGQDDLPPRDARRLLGSGALLGFSSHNAGQLCAAAGEPVDYVALGPVYATGSKRNADPVVGVAEVRRCRALVEKPLVAIGGITMENALECWARAPIRWRWWPDCCRHRPRRRRCGNGWKNGKR